MTMRPTETRGATNNFTPPENWDPRTDGHCGDLQVRRETFGERNIIECFSTWKPTPEEIAHIVAGGVIEIGLCIPKQPVTQVCVVNPVEPALVKYVAAQDEHPELLEKAPITINEKAHGDYHDDERG
jgi:hypothetical protein